MRRIGSGILIVGLGLLGGCSSSTGASNGSGILTGGIYLCGGFSDHGCPGVVVAGIPAKSNPGTVVVSSSGHTVATASVADGQNYRIRLPPGTYTVSSGSVPNSVRAVISAGRTTTANLVNNVP
jgi:hypothetical protein